MKWFRRERLPKAKGLRFPKSRAKSHIQLIGATGSLKSALATRFVAQAIASGSAAFVLNPKKEERQWDASVLAETCERKGVPFVYLDLTADVPQFNILQGVCGTELESLFTAGFGLETVEGKPGVSHYRAEDRKAMLKLCDQVLPSDYVRLKDLLGDGYKRKVGAALWKGAAGFVTALEETARVTAIDSDEGGQFEKVIAEGGCVYIVGSLEHEAQRRLMRMCLVRIIQLVRKVGRPQRHVVMFVDEIQHFQNEPFLVGLETIRSAGGQFIVAEQSLGNHLNEAARERVTANCQVKIVLGACANVSTARWAEEMSGKLISERQFLSLPDGYAVVFGAIPRGWWQWWPTELARVVRVRPVPVKLRRFSVGSQVRSAAQAKVVLSQPSSTDLAAVSPLRS